MNIPEIKQTRIVCIKIINPIDIGWLIKNIKKEKIIKLKEKNIFIISKNSL